MNYSIEELYALYGQYDTNIYITFHYQSPSFLNFGSTLMGTIIYTEEERNSLQATIQQEPFPMTQGTVRLLPSSVIDVTNEQYELAERYGFSSSDIFEISAYNRPRTNRFTEKDKKEVKVAGVIKLNGWKRQDLNHMNYGFLDSRLRRGEMLSPDEKLQFLGLRKYFKQDINVKPFSDWISGNDRTVRYFELDAQMSDLIIEEPEIKELAELLVERYNYRESLIKAEIDRSGQRLNEVAQAYGDELKNLRKVCHSFNEDIILFGTQIVYLDLERFIHIYARHVVNTYVAGNFTGKTFFQYKFDDIINIIKLVVESESKQIQAHFKEQPGKPFIRMGKRSVYYDGHYYRVEIEPSGRLLTFHPYNNNEERDADQ